MAAICVAILRYGLMRFTPAQASREIISAIDEAVFLIDTGWRASDLNDSALYLTGRSDTEKQPSSMDDVFVRADPLRQCLDAMTDPESRTCSRSELLRTECGTTVLVRADFHMIADRWGDRIGILCICRQEKDIAAFIRRHGLSRREGDILRHTITGCTQAETADALGLSLPTVKTHTTGLYNKLGISSRNGLYAMLRDEGLDATHPGVPGRLSRSSGVG